MRWDTCRELRTTIAGLVIRTDLCRLSWTVENRAKPLRLQIRRAAQHGRPADALRFASRAADACR
jgi:hypothetical protein